MRTIILLIILAAFLAMPTYATVELRNSTANVTGPAYLSGNNSVRIEAYTETPWYLFRSVNASNMNIGVIRAVTTNVSNAELTDFYVYSNTYNTVYRMNLQGSVYVASVEANFTDLISGSPQLSIDTNDSNTDLRTILVCSGNSDTIRIAQRTATSWAIVENTTLPGLNCQAIWTNATNEPINDVWYGHTSANTIQHVKRAAGAFASVENWSAAPGSCTNSAGYLGIWSNETIEPRNFWGSCTVARGVPWHIENTSVAQYVRHSQTTQLNISTGGRAITSNETGQEPRFLVLASDGNENVSFLRRRSFDQVGIQMNISGTYALGVNLNVTAHHQQINNTYSLAGLCGNVTTIRAYANVSNGSSVSGTGLEAFPLGIFNRTRAAWNLTLCTVVATDNFTFSYVGTTNFSGEVVLPRIPENATASSCKYRILGAQNYTIRNDSVRCVIVLENRSSSASITLTAEAFQALSIANAPNLSAALLGAGAIAVVYVARRRVTTKT